MCPGTSRPGSPGTQNVRQRPDLLLEAGGLGSLLLSVHAARYGGPWPPVAMDIDTEINSNEIKIPFLSGTEHISSAQ